MGSILNLEHPCDGNAKIYIFILLTFSLHRRQASRDAFVCSVVIHDHDVYAQQLQLTTCAGLCSERKSIERICDGLYCHRLQLSSTVYVCLRSTRHIIINISVIRGCTDRRTYNLNMCATT